MQGITHKEAEFLILLLEENKRKYNGDDVVVGDHKRSVKMHNVDIYFLQQKLEKLT